MAHALTEMARRKIDAKHIEQVLHDPEQAYTVRLGRTLYQSRIELGHQSKTYLIRVFVDIDRDPPEVVTVYRTSKVEKYWRAD